MEKIILSIICVLKYLYEKFEYTYKITYADTSLSKKANNEIRKRKEHNKKMFIKNVMLHAQQDFYNRTGKEMSDKEAEVFAEKMYAIARQKGDIDELGNFTDD